MADNWMDELYQMHNEDKAKQEVSKKNVAPLDLSILSKNRTEMAAAAMRSVNALAVVRRLQSALLGGKGIIDTFDGQEDYDQTITLAWQGTFSTARKPEGMGHYWCVLVGARGKKIFVNHNEVTPLTPENFKAALVEAAKTPIKVKPNKNSK